MDEIEVIQSVQNNIPDLILVSIQMAPGYEPVVPLRNHGLMPVAVTASTNKSERKECLKVSLNSILRLLS